MGSRLRSDAKQTLEERLDPWLKNPPDYYDVTESYRVKGLLESSIKLKEREIARAEELVTIDQDRPRSNEAKKAKLEATSKLKDELAELQSQHAIIDSEVKALEFRLKMFSAATYSTKVRFDIT